VARPLIRISLYVIIVLVIIDACYTASPNYGFSWDTLLRYFGIVLLLAFGCIIIELRRFFKNFRFWYRAKPIAIFTKDYIEIKFPEEYLIKRENIQKVELKRFLFRRYILFEFRYSVILNDKNLKELKWYVPRLSNGINQLREIINV